MGSASLHSVPYHCSHGQITGVSSSWCQAPTQGAQYRRSGCGHQLQLMLSCSKELLLPRLELGREWHSTGHNLPQWCCPEGLEGKCHPVLQLSVTAAVASVVMAQHNQTGHTSQTRSGIGTHQTLLSFCSSSSGRAAEWELGVHHGWKDLSFSSHQTTPTAHSQRARHRESEGVTNPLPVTDTAAYVGSLAKTSVPQGCSHRTTRWPNADQDPPVLEELS